MRLITTMISTLLLTNIALSADRWTIDAGAGVLSNSASGTIRSTLNQTLEFKDTLDTHDETKDGYFYISLKHPIPILPNIRLEYVDVSTSGNSTEVGVKSTFIPGNIAISSSDVKSSLGMTQYDAILFYNLLDQTMGMTLDLGLDVKYLVSDYKVDAVIESSDSSVIPLVYVRGRFDIPMVDIGLEGDVKYITDGSSTVYDLRVKVDYTMMFIPVVHPGIELGYRIEQFTSDGDESSLIGPILSSDTDSDIGFSGIYGGITVKF